VPTSCLFLCPFGPCCGGSGRRILGPRTIHIRRSRTPIACLLRSRHMTLPPVGVGE
jgi:hypothetical protein